LSAFIVVISAALLPGDGYAGFALLLLVLMLTAVLSGIGLATLWRRSFPLLLLVLASSSLMFTVPGEHLATVPYTEITISRPGTILFGSVLLRATISIQTAMVLISLTPIHEILGALRSFRVPLTVVETAGFMFAYINVLVDEVVAVVKARSARTGRLRGFARPSAAWQLRTGGGMLGSLLVRTLERSERVHGAMLSRAVGGHYWLAERRSYDSGDTSFIVGVAACCAAALLLAAS